MHPFLLSVSAKLMILLEKTAQPQTDNRVLNPTSIVLASEAGQISLRLPTSGPSLRFAEIVAAAFRQQSVILLLPVEIGRLADPGLAADLPHCNPVMALLQDERLLCVRKP